MGWGYGVNAEGREVGYSVQAVCDAPGCEEKIDHGLAYVCGDMHDGDEHSCGQYFCYEHLYFGLGLPNQMCGPCADRFREENPEVIEAAIEDFNRRLGLAQSRSEGV